MKNKHFTLIKPHKQHYRSNYLLFSVVIALLLIFNHTSTFANDIKNNSKGLEIPTGKSVVSSVIYEAEEYYEVVSDVANTFDDINRAISIGYSEAASGNQAVSLPDPNDKIKIDFTVDEDAEYMINIRFRSGTKLSPASYIDETFDYIIALNSNAIDFTYNESSISSLSPNFGGSYWGVVESDQVFTTELATGTIHSIEISMKDPATYGYVDYVEIVKIADTDSFTPETPGQAQNLSALIRGKSTIDIGWNPVPGADSYELQYSTDDGANYMALATTGKYSVYYGQSDLEANTTYAYRVRALRTGATPEEGAWSDTVNAITALIPDDFYFVNHMATIGDDLALGTTAAPAGEFTASNYIFDADITAEDGTALEDMPTNGNGGVAISQAYHTNTLISNVTTANNDYTGYEFLGTVSGLTSATIADLAKGTDPYNKLLAQITNGAALADDKSLSYQFRGVNLLQGAADADTDTLTYKEALIQFATDLNADLNTALTTTDVEYPIFLIQSADPQVAVAQYRAAQASTNLYIASPSYFVAESEAGRQHIGHYLAKAYKKVVFDKTSWSPIAPLNISKEANKVMVEFSVAVEPLVLDVTTIADAGDYGFELYDEVGQLTITDVQIEGSNTVTITTDRNIEANAKILYAASDAKTTGNLRDSDTQASTLGDYDLYNWAVSFEEMIENVPPNVPTGLTAVASSDESISLTWDALAYNVGEYTIEYSLSNDPYDFMELDVVDKTITDYEHTGLDPETTYYYRIYASNLNLVSEYSDTVSTTTDPEIPVAPTGLVASAVSDVQIDLTWDAVDGTVTGYVIESATVNEDASFTQIDSVGSDVTSVSHIELTASTTYYYRVKAVNTISSSEYSDVVSETTMEPVPDAPTSLAATAFSETQIDLTWTLPASDITGLVLERALMNEEEDFSEVASLDASATTYSDTDLEPATTYYYRIKAVNETGDSEYSSTVSATTDASTLGEPTDLVATDSTASTISISWTAGADEIEEYVVESSATGATNEFEVLATIASTETSYTHEGLTADTTVYYRVKGINSVTKSVYSNIISVSTLPVTPAVPANFTAVATDADKVTLSWDAVTENVDGYVIEEATSEDGPYTEIAVLEATETSTVRTVPSPGTTYYYRIKATNGSASSEYSTTQTVITAIDKALAFSAFNLYPNPSTGEFSVEIQAPKQETGFLKIYSTAGNVIFENTIDTSFNKKFNLNNLSQGLFIVEVKTKSYHQVKKLLVK
ncbi:fibronectin type III domain-containing protein [Chondrinema litorale]|uniref:fibronectin type III domain-containing protein n=1 Tax=Chondrinema litorale TaxID=2994555 RepID=UPI0025428760|nr:fibronectin type III domain-containing protein [Chondrinema litorale]UZR92992.1 fibronectin type III domain-containing protein [Chondrinema litorale]